jgi:ribokinase
MAMVELYWLLIGWPLGTAAVAQRGARVTNPRIVVLGSANLDLVYSVARIPEPGETLLATGATQHPGGKGNNQVIAVARAGASVAFIAALGTDSAGDLLKRSLEEAGVIDLVRRVDEPTGTALITVDESAENTIVVNSGANATLRNLTKPEADAIRAADFLLMQLETPLETVIEAASLASSAGTTVVVNAAPARELPVELLNHVDVLIVNEHEALIVAGGLPNAGPLPPTVSVNTAAAVAEDLRAAVPSVVLTLGADGAVVVNSSGAVHVPARKVTPVDTTGAGDTLCGALVAALAEGQDLVEATTFATAAASLSVQREGAVPSIPSRAEIDAILE